MRTIVRHTLVATAAATLTATLVAAPAQAEQVRLDDGADAASLTDIRVVRARHSDDRVRVKVNFPDLRKNADATLNFYFDSDPSQNGPERVLSTPLFSGGDYALWRMKDWKYVGAMPVGCDYGMTFKWRRDFVVFSGRRGCFGRPNELRVGLRMRDAADASHPVTDWLKGRRQFTRWLDAGASNA